MRHGLLIIMLLFTSVAKAQETPASPVLMNLGPIDGESDQKQSVITIRYDSKPSFAKAQLEAHGSFIQVILPNTIVLKPGMFIEANSPYIRKLAAFQIDEDTAGVRLFVTKEAAHLLPAFTADILENRVVVVLDHVKAEKELLVNFNGVPVEGGPTPEQIVKDTEVKRNVPDPVQIMSASIAEKAPESKVLEPIVAELPKAGPEPLTAGSLADAAKNAPAKPKVEAIEPVKAPEFDLEGKLVAVTLFVVAMLLLLIGVKTWRRLAVKTLPPGMIQDFSLKTLATHALGPKQKVSVIQVGQEQFLLGISPDNISFLTILNKPESNRLSIDPQQFQRVMPAMKNAAREQVLSDVRSPVPEKLPKERERKPEPGSSIRYGVGDQGIKNLKTPSKEAENNSNLDDVTRLIRKKLKDLPKV